MIAKLENDDMDYDPYRDGWNERLEHRQQSDNPFGVNNWKFYEWEKGWLAANKALSEEQTSTPDK